jgi:hypothetical protein
MGLKQISEQSTNRLFIVDDQNIAIIDRRRLAGWLGYRLDIHRRTSRVSSVFSDGRNAQSLSVAFVSGWSGMSPGCTFHAI